MVKRNCLNVQEGDKTEDTFPMYTHNSYQLFERVFMSLYREVKALSGTG